MIMAKYLPELAIIKPGEVCFETIEGLDEDDPDQVFHVRNRSMLSKETKKKHGWNRFAYQEEIINILYVDDEPVLHIMVMGQGIIAISYTDADDRKVYVDTELNPVEYNPLDDMDKWQHALTQEQFEDMMQLIEGGQL